MKSPLSNPEIIAILDEATKDIEKSYLDLLNDDVNSFDHVIECLMRYCKHEPEQAEQLALLVHTRGKATIKSGNRFELLPIKQALESHQLTIEIH